MSAGQTDFFREPEPETPVLTRCVSLWQPWASLIACGMKTVETRPRHAPVTIIGQRIGIHAALTKKGMYLATKDRVLWEACIQGLNWSEDGNLPFGALVATALVVSSHPVKDLTKDIYGDYSSGRFGWKLADIEPFPEPIPFKGAQGIFFADLQKLLSKSP